MQKYLLSKKAWIVFLMVLLIAMGSCINTEAASLNHTKATIYVGGSKLKLKLSGSKAKNWKSSKKSVATVSKKGVVTPKKTGKTTITCTDKNNKKYKCVVSVRKPYLDKKSATIKMDQEKTLQLNLVGIGVKSYVSSNNKVAVVSKKGVVTAKKPGKVTITCKGKNGKKYTCKVTVSCLHSKTKVVNEKKASCMEAGYTGDTYCETCNKMMKKGQAVASGEHNYQEKYTYFEATCNRPGIVACVCVDCGAGMYKETEKTQNHIYDYMNGTYTDEGYATTCTMCGIKLMAPCPHGDLVQKGVVAASCGVDGYTGDYHCAYCDELILKGEVVAGNAGHSWELWDQVAATCTKDGYEHYICNLCGVGIDLITETKKGHTEKQETVSSNCISNGYIKKYCEQCGTDLGTTELPLIGHEYYIGEGGWIYCKSEGSIVKIELLSRFSDEHLGSLVEIPPETLLTIQTMCPVDVSYNECLERIYPKIQIISSNPEVLEVNELNTITAKKAWESRDNHLL